MESKISNWPINKNNILKIKKQYYNGVLLPNQIEINVIAGCTRSCSFCPVSLDGFYEQFKYVKNYMTMKIFKIFIKNLKQINYSGELVFSGWCEPLLHKNIIEFLEIISHEIPEAKSVIVTNGDLLNDDMLLKFKKVNLKVLLISLYDGDWQIKKFNHMNKNVNFDNILFRKRYGEFKKTNRGGLLNSNTNNNTSCYYPFYFLMLDLNGDVTFCSHNFAKLNILGNIKNTTIFNIWKNDDIRLKMINNKRHDIDACKHCDVDGHFLGKSFFNEWVKIYD